MRKENDEALHNEVENATIEPQDEAASAGEASPEDTLAAYQELFEKQRKALDDSSAKIASLHNQIGILMRNGASVGSAASQEPTSDEAPEPYVSLTDLGREIGKRDYQSHNLKRD